jgi:hypothetical protein
MIYCGSLFRFGFLLYFRNVLVPVPAPVPFPVPVLNLDFVQNLAFSMLEAALFPRKLAPNF